MKGVILAGGTGSRLAPLTKTINKHLLPVGSKPMIYWPLKTLKDMGVTEILVVTGGNDIGNFLHQLGDGSDFGVDLTFKIQTEANGIAGALKTARSFVGNDSCLVILGDNIFIPSNNSEKGLGALIRDTASRNKAAIVLQEVDDPERFGVISFDGDNKFSIIEKPVNPPSNKAVTGLYCYPPDVFDVIDTLEPSLRGELEITDVNNYYCEASRIHAIYFKGFWHDAGTHDSLRVCNDFIYDKDTES